jgi:tetratricopeptide (TPR) repeat protein
MLRHDFPDHGVKLLDGRDPLYQVAEASAVLETSDASEAEKVVSKYAGLSEIPIAASLMARIDWDLGRQDAALARLKKACESDPKDASLRENLVETLIAMGKGDDAREAAGQFLASFPNLGSAQLCFLEAHGSRKGDDHQPWMKVCAHFLAQFRRDPSALARLASAASAQGWNDLSFLLYENSLQENLSGFPFAIYYVASLVKQGDFDTAESVWRQLSVRNATELAGYPHIAAMLAWGAGHESEAQQILERIRKETADSPHKRAKYEKLFREFGFPQIAEDLAATT